MTTAPMPRGGSFFSRPDEPFIWGRGGKRLSQDDIAMQRQLAARNMAAGSDYSPIQSPWQGFARVAQGLTGGMQMRSADKASAANAETTQQAIEAALAQPGPVEGGNDPVTALLANPQTQALGMQLLKARQPQQVEPVIQRANNGDIIGLNPMTGEIIFQQADPNPKPVINWQRVTDPLTGAVEFVPFGPNGPLNAGGASGAPVLGTDLPEGWTIDEGGPGGAPSGAGFPGY